MSEKNKRFSNSIHIKNRKASFEYALLDKFETGIVLKGTEMKSIREGKVSLKEAYCYVNNGEVIIKGMHISPYLEASFEQHQNTRDRKLLLKKKEIIKLAAKSAEKGLSIIPISIYTNTRGFAKLQIALAKGKKLYDKREDIKKKDQTRAIKRNL